MFRIPLRSLTTTLDWSHACTEVSSGYVYLSTCYLRTLVGNSRRAKAPRGRGGGEGEGVAIGNSDRIPHNVV